MNKKMDIKKIFLINFETSWFQLIISILIYSSSSSRHCGKQYIQIVLSCITPHTKGISSSHGDVK